MKSYKLDFKRYNNHPNLYNRLLLKSFRLGKKHFFYRIIFYFVKRAHHNEIPIETKIGPGLFINHSYNITINGNAIIGCNCNLTKNVLIGEEFRGPRKGAPIIGDNVFFGCGCVVVGKINIGNNVLIAANSFVNCDIPDNSIVFGNPCTIKQSNDATKDYVVNTISLDEAVAND